MHNVNIVGKCKKEKYLTQSNFAGKVHLYFLFFAYTVKDIDGRLYPFMNLQIYPHRIDLQIDNHQNFAVL